MEKEKKPYYLGIDSGTDSVGHAATNTEYELLNTNAVIMTAYSAVQWRATMLPTRTI